MERKDLGLGRGQYPVDLEEEFNNKVLEYWIEGKIPHNMVNVNSSERCLEIYYGYA
jgi:hypothetical protein